MPPNLSSLLLVVVCGLAFSGLDLARKGLSTRMPPLPLLAYFAVGQVPAFALWVVWADATGPAPGYYAPALGSAALNLLANLAFLESVRRSPLSLTIPLLSLTPVFTLLLAIPLVHELPTGTQALGTVLVVAGAFALHLDAGGGGLTGTARALAREPGSAFMAGAALFWSLSLPLDKLAIERASPPVHGLVLNVAVGIAALVMLAARRRLAELRAARGCWRLLAAAIGITTVALAAQLLAMVRVWVSVIETLKRAIGNLMALALGRAVFGERFTPARLLAALVMAAGVALILL